MSKPQIERRVSLQETMNRMAGRMDSLLEDHQRDQPTPETTNSHEIRFWIAVDPVLADLHKYLIDAKANRTRLATRHGDDDLMTDIADDVVDSAQCAVDTRLIELRQNQETKAVVAAMIRKAQDARYEESVAVIRARSNAFWKDFARPRTQVQVQKQAVGSFWSLMIAVVTLRYALQQTNRLLSIAATFSAVSANDDLRLTLPIAGSA